ncbi:uncharacterized protein N7518_005911 [Penicillium psychrosexuale]|uniref:uncharacterized protein n=1 Tax=Penicillium psychrosexuale TaxID=1002107 RepID=UPI0025454926|nr:uncharacterized protein N7518_005911 [Penicillium psychrosexuale]KAJ5788900.1 hypothetical protein N7518_005911 [Penicillium psychrosexuale]
MPVELLRLASEKGPKLALKVGGVVLLYLVIKKIECLVIWWAQLEVQHLSPQLSTLPAMTADPNTAPVMTPVIDKHCKEKPNALKITRLSTLADGYSLFTQVPIREKKSPLNH